jgi:hypothetical protein
VATKICSNLSASWIAEWIDFSFTVFPHDPSNPYPVSRKIDLTEHINHLKIIIKAIRRIHRQIKFESFDFIDITPANSAGDILEDPDKGNISFDQAMKALKTRSMKSSMKRA